MIETRFYASPFEGIYDGSRVPYYYNGNLAGVLDDLKVATLMPDDPDALPLLALQPPRVIRAALNNKVDHPRSKGAHALLTAAVQLGLGIYQDPHNAYERVVYFRGLVENIGAEDLLRRPLEQLIDQATWKATDPKLSRLTAERLVDKVGGEDVLLIALGHGGVAAGMDVYLNYLDLSASSASEFYTVRFSHKKLHDSVPIVTRREVNYLRAQALRRKVVIFDEDVSTGETMTIATRFLKKVIDPEEPVLFETNFDARPTHNTYYLNH